MLLQALQLRSGETAAHATGCLRGVVCPGGDGRGELRDLLAELGDIRAELVRLGAQGVHVLRLGPALQCVEYEGLQTITVVLRIRGVGMALEMVLRDP